MDELYDAIRHKDFRGMVALLARIDDINRQDRSGETPLTYAVSVGDPDIVAALLNAGADVNVHGFLGCTPLMAAVSSGAADKVGLMRLLLAHGAEVDARKLPYRETYGGSTALMFATYFASLEMVSLLVEAGADVNAVTDGKTGWSVLMNAVLKPNRYSGVTLANQLAVIQYLLEKGAKIEEEKQDTEDDWIPTVWTFAEEYGQEEILQLLRSAAAKK